MPNSEPEMSSPAERAARQTRTPNAACVSRTPGLPRRLQSASQRATRSASSGGHSSGDAMRAPKSREAATVTPVKMRKARASQSRGGSYGLNHAATGSPSFACRKQLLMPELEGSTGRHTANGRPDAP